MPAVVFSFVCAQQVVGSIWDSGKSHKGKKANLVDHPVPQFDNSAQPTSDRGAVLCPLFLSFFLSSTSCFFPSFALSSKAAALLPSVGISLRSYGPTCSNFPTRDTITLGLGARL